MEIGISWDERGGKGVESFKARGLLRCWALVEGPNSLIIGNRWIELGEFLWAFGLEFGNWI